MPEHAAHDAGIPVTKFERMEEEQPPEGQNEKAQEKHEPLPEPLTPQPKKMRARVLEFAEQAPELQGGLSSYYINIDYPQAAIDANIQGRLILSFVVERNGIPSHIEVLKSLHPLCDSAAVRALRDTRFVPGQQNGELVRVRMRLPVRFQLIGPQPSSTATSASTEDSGR